MAQLWPSLKLQLPPVHPMLLELSDDASDSLKALPPVYTVNIDEAEEKVDDVS